MGKVGIISQARMTSTRLPGKILKEARNKPLLQIHLDRLKILNMPIYLATTVNKTDDPVVDLCDQLHVKCYRGSEDHVLSRFYELAQQEKLDVIVRVTSDCPLIDENLIEQAVKQYMEWNEPNIYYSNCLVRTYPRGFDFEVFSFQNLEEAYLKATEKSDIEHVTPYINKNRNGKIIVKHFTDADDLSHFRFTVDESDDFFLLKKMIEDHRMDQMTYSDIKKVIMAHPTEFLTNSHVEQKNLK